MFNNLPNVTKNILILNIVFFVVTWVLELQGIDLSSSFGAHYVNSVLFKPFQIVTHFFMHGNFLHIFFNMWMFIMLGAYLEQIWGPKRYFIFYLLCAFGAFGLYNIFGAFEIESLKNELIVKGYDLYNTNNLIVNNNSIDLIIEELIKLGYSNPEINNILSAPNKNSILFNELRDNPMFNYIIKSETPMVGASGAISGLMAAFAILFPNTEFRLYFAIPVKAKYLVTAYFLFDVYMAYQNNADDNTAHLAHIGGAIVGAIIVLIWRKKDRTNFW